MTPQNSDRDTLCELFLPPPITSAFIFYVYVILLCRLACNLKSMSNLESTRKIYHLNFSLMQVEPLLELQNSDRDTLCQLFLPPPITSAFLFYVYVLFLSRLA